MAGWPVHPSVLICWATAENTVAGMKVITLDLTTGSASDPAPAVNGMLADVALAAPSLASCSL